MNIKYRDLRLEDKSREKQIVNLFKDFLSSGFYLRSKKTNLIEKKISSFIGHNYCHLLSSGTNSIYLALKALGIKKGDEVICPIISWVATANAISILGAKPIFVDVKLDQNIDINLVEKKISRKTKAIIAVHFKGIICDIINLKKIAKKNKIFLVEDVAQAFGAQIFKKKAGSFGDIACYSFNPMKVLKSFGELGAITTNNKKFYKKIKSLQYLGTINKEICVDVDLNSKSDELHAYLISNGLKYLKKDILSRKRIIYNYIKYLPNSIIHKNYDVKKSNGYDYQILVRLNCEGAEDDVIYSAHDCFDSKVKMVCGSLKDVEGVKGLSAYKKLKRYMSDNELPFVYFSSAIDTWPKAHNAIINLLDK